MCNHHICADNGQGVSQESELTLNCVHASVIVVHFSSHTVNPEPLMAGANDGHALWSLVKSMTLTLETPGCVDQ